MEFEKTPAVGNRVYTNDVRLCGLRNMEFELKTPAVGNRVYTNDVRLCGLRNMEFERNVRWLTPRYATTLQPAEAGFVCVDAV